jgi:5'-3' exonuclease
LTHADDIKENRIKELIISHKENIALSHELATIRKDVPIECNLEQTQFTWFNERLKEFLSSFQIKSLQERIFSTKNQPKQPSAIPEKKKATDDQIDLFS